MISTSRLQLIFFIILTAGVSVLAFFIFKPYLGPIFLAAIVAIASYPFYKKLLKIFGGKSSVASFFAVLIILAAVLVPAVFISLALFKEATVLYGNMAFWQTGGEDFLNTATNFIEDKIKTFSPDFSVDLAGYLSGFANWIVGHIDNLFSGFFNVLIGLLLMIISLFYFLKDGELIIKRLVFVSPLSDFYDEQIIKTVGLAIWGVVLIGLSDNFLSPILMKKGMKIHSFVILLSILGGLGFFGPIGFIAGPVVLSLLFALFDIYPLITKKIIDEKNEIAG